MVAIPFLIFFSIFLLQKRCLEYPLKLLWAIDKCPRQTGFLFYLVSVTKLRSMILEQNFYLFLIIIMDSMFRQFVGKDTTKKNQQSVLDDYSTFVKKETNK